MNQDYHNIRTFFQSKRDSSDQESEPGSSGSYEVEAILDCRMLKNTTEPSEGLELKLKWKGYLELTWEPIKNIHPTCYMMIYKPLIAEIER